ncbi:MAG: 3'-5' exonuclease [Candidatus Eremiobacteraeota bacterium]|nr:3'-5' exonuclease [Candidatus Eremiobacteraeota bacterium]
MVRTNTLLKQYESALKEKNIPTYLIKRSQSEDTRSQGIRLATMHRVKGLEFDYVIVASVNKDIILLKLAEDEMFCSDQEPEYCERALLHVAATRAKKDVLVTSYGAKSPYIT